MAVTRATIENIKGKIVIEEVIGDFVALKRKSGGHTFWGCCPFHSERTPSFSVHSEKGFYKCFGCGKGGDAITFLKEKEGMEYLEAMRFLAEKYGVPWEEEERKGSYKEEQDARDQQHILLDIATDYYCEKLQESREAQAYIEERGIPASLVEKFKLGYSTTAWDDFYLYAKGKGYEATALEEVGLLAERDGRLYDRLRGRLTFLLRSSSGQPIGIAGRLIRPQERAPKYVNPPETKVYQKSHFLYGLYEGKEAIRKAKNVYLVEGYTDVLALHKAGIPNVVASSGTSLTTSQIHLLRRFTKRVTLLFDGDEAGNQAALRGIDLLLAADVEVKVVSLPFGEDPDVYLKAHGSEALQKYLVEKAEDFVTFKMYRLQKENESAEERSLHIEEVVKSLALIPSPIRRGVYMELLQKITGLAKEELQEGVRRYRNDEASPMTPRQPKKRIVFFKESDARYTEEALLHILLLYGDRTLKGDEKVATYLFEKLKDVGFRVEVYQAIFASFKSLWEKGGNIALSAFLEQVDEALKPQVVDVVSKRYTISKGWEEKHQIFTDEVTHILEELIDRNILLRQKDFVGELLREQTLLLASASEEEVDAHLERHMQIKGLHKHFLNQIGTIVLAVPQEAERTLWKGKKATTRPKEVLKN